MVGETNRAPFDLAEAEGELVGGFHTEYSSLKFALFFLAEYVNMVAVSSLATTMFLGGYHALPGLGFTEHWLGGWFTMVWYLVKVSAFLYLYIWLRGTLPRMRYDQFMKFGWKVLIPVALVWIIVVSTLRAFSQQGTSKVVVLGFTSGAILIALAAISLYDRAKKSKSEAEANKVFVEPDFPVPSLPFQVSTLTVGEAKHE